MLKRFEKKNKELEDFQPIKQEIVYKVNDEMTAKEQTERNKQVFKKELLTRVKTYLLDLPIGVYKIDYSEVFKDVKSDYNSIEIRISTNLDRSLTDRLSDRNKKAIEIGKNQSWIHKIDSWQVDDILKFHNNLEKIMLIIGKNYGYEPKKEDEESQVSLIP